MSRTPLNQVLDSGYIKIGTVVSLIAAAVAFSVKDTQHKLRMEFAVTHLSQKVDENAQLLNRLNDKVTGKSPGGWHRDTMERWVLEAEKLNPGIKFPDPWDPDYDPRPE
jgi:hypothetical protein